jgi:hypothetical protein
MTSIRTKSRKTTASAVDVAVLIAGGGMMTVTAAMTGAAVIAMTAAGADPTVTTIVGGAVAMTTAAIGMVGLIVVGAVIETRIATAVPGTGTTIAGPIGADGVETIETAARSAEGAGMTTGTHRAAPGTGTMIGGGRVAAMRTTPGIGRGSEMTGGLGVTAIETPRLTAIVSAAGRGRTIETPRGPVTLIEPTAAHRATVTRIGEARAARETKTTGFGTEVYNRDYF